MFNIFAENIDCGYTLEPPWRDSSNECPQSMFWIKNKKICIPLYYSSIPHFYYIKVGFKGVFISRTCFPDEDNQPYDQDMIWVFRICTAIPYNSFRHLFLSYTKHSQLEKVP